MLKEKEKKGKEKKHLIEHCFNSLFDIVRLLDSSYFQSFQEAVFDNYRYKVFRPDITEKVI